MNLLEYCHNQHNQHDNYVDRKINLPEDKDINLYGVRGAGKSAMALDYLNYYDKKESLYIDFDDPHLIFETFTFTLLQEYIDEQHIKYLVLDHYTEDKIDVFPKVHQLIIVSRIKLEHPRFEELKLYPLDYEEFLAFGNAYVNTSALNYFIRMGSLPSVARQAKTQIVNMKRFMQSNFEKNEYKLLLILAQLHTKHVTIHQIYTHAKQQFKVSKDWLYKIMKEYEKEGIVIFVEDDYKKGAKKMFLFDFAFAKYLNIEQAFVVQFDSMIALAMLKHCVEYKTFGSYGYVTNKNELILVSPFESEESMWVKSKNKFSLYKKFGIKKVNIITVANHYNYKIENLFFEALPFNEWSITMLEQSEAL